MKSVVLGVVMVLFLVSSGWAEGYKDFKWGDSPASIRKKVADLDEGFGGWFNGILMAYIYQKGHLYKSSIPNPLSKAKGKITSLESKKMKATFWFLDSKLFAVGISFDEESPLSTLQKKYGKVKSDYMSQISNDYEIKVWFPNTGRVVVYDKLFEGYGWERLTYIDSSLYSKLAIETENEKKIERKKDLNKID